MADNKHNQKRDFKTAVEDAKALATVLAMEAESVLGRRTVRVLGGVVAFALLVVLLNWFISPDDAKERQGLALVLAIGAGGIAAIVGLYFTRQTLLTTRKVEADRAREAALRACLEQLGRLLTHDKWSTKDQEGDTDNTLRNLARAETLSVLGTLDGPRKRILVRFLYESQLLNKDIPGVNLNGADLRRADLSRLKLSNASLSGVRLRGANLSRATLSGSDLSGSDLRDLSNGDRVPTKLLISAEIAKHSLVGSLLMDNSLSKEATDWREGRRLRAFELKQQGWSQQRIAEALGVSKGAVSQWMKRAHDGGGAEALRRRPAAGARPRLSEEQRMELPELLERGAEAHGFRGKVWTGERVAELIDREFGVRYHPAHVSRLVRALGLSLQKPARRADQRDEEAIDDWKENRWPELKRGLRRRAGP